MTDTSLRAVARRRITLATLAAVTVAAGLLVHRFGTGILGDVAGDALYATMIYLVIACLLARSSRRLAAALAIVFCSGIELLQLTGLPRSLAETFPPAALVLGVGFDLRDLIVYATAILIALLLDVTVSKSARRGERH